MSERGTDQGLEEIDFFEESLQIQIAQMKRETEAARLQNKMLSEDLSHRMGSTHHSRSSSSRRNSLSRRTSLSRSSRPSIGRLSIGDPSVIEVTEERGGAASFGLGISHHQSNRRKTTLLSEKAGTRRSSRRLSTALPEGVKVSVSDILGAAGEKTAAAAAATRKSLGGRKSLGSRRKSTSRGACADVMATPPPSSFVTATTGNGEKFSFPMASLAPARSAGLAASSFADFVASLQSQSQSQPQFSSFSSGSSSSSSAKAKHQQAEAASSSSTTTTTTTTTSAPSRRGTNAPSAALPALSPAPAPVLTTLPSAGHSLHRNNTFPPASAPSTLPTPAAPPAATPTRRYNTRSSSAAAAAAAAPDSISALPPDATPLSALKHQLASLQWDKIFAPSSKPAAAPAPAPVAPAPAAPVAPVAPAHTPTSSRRRSVSKELAALGVVLPPGSPVPAPADAPTTRRVTRSSSRHSLSATQPMPPAAVALSVGGDGPAEEVRAPLHPLGTAGRHNHHPTDAKTLGSLKAGVATTTSTAASAPASASASAALACGKSGLEPSLGKLHITEPEAAEQQQQSPAAPAARPASSQAAPLAPHLRGTISSPGENSPVRKVWRAPPQIRRAPVADPTASPTLPAPTTAPACVSAIPCKLGTPAAPAVDAPPASASASASASTTACPAVTHVAAAPAPRAAASRLADPPVKQAASAPAGAAAPTTCATKVTAAGAPCPPVIPAKSAPATGPATASTARRATPVGQLKDPPLPVKQPTPAAVCNPLGSPNLSQVVRAGLKALATPPHPQKAAPALVAPVISTPPLTSSSSSSTTTTTTTTAGAHVVLPAAPSTPPTQIAIPSAHLGSKGSTTPGPAGHPPVSGAAAPCTSAISTPPRAALPSPMSAAGSVIDSPQCPAAQERQPAPVAKPRRLFARFSVAVNSGTAAQAGEEGTTSAQSPAPAAPAAITGAALRQLQQQHAYHPPSPLSPSAIWLPAMRPSQVPGQRRIVWADGSRDDDTFGFTRFTHQMGALLRGDVPGPRQPPPPCATPRKPTLRTSRTGRPASAGAALSTPTRGRPAAVRSATPDVGSPLPQEAMKAQPPTPLHRRSHSAPPQSSVVDPGDVDLFLDTAPAGPPVPAWSSPAPAPAPAPALAPVPAATADGEADEANSSACDPDDFEEDENVVFTEDVAPAPAAAAAGGDALDNEWTSLMAAARDEFADPAAAAGSPLASTPLSATAMSLPPPPPTTCILAPEEEEGEPLGADSGLLTPLRMTPTPMDPSFLPLDVLALISSYLPTFVEVDLFAHVCHSFHAAVARTYDVMNPLLLRAPLIWPVTKKPDDLFPHHLGPRITWLRLNKLPSISLLFRILCASPNLVTLDLRNIGQLPEKAFEVFWLEKPWEYMDEVPPVLQVLEDQRLHQGSEPLSREALLGLLHPVQKRHGQRAAPPLSQAGIFHCFTSVKVLALPRVLHQKDAFAFLLSRLLPDVRVILDNPDQPTNFAGMAAAYCREIGQGIWENMQQTIFPNLEFFIGASKSDERRKTQLLPHWRGPVLEARHQAFAQRTLALFDPQCAAPVDGPSASSTPQQPQSPAYSSRPEPAAPPPAPLPPPAPAYPRKALPAGMYRGGYMKLLRKGHFAEAMRLLELGFPMALCPTLSTPYREASNFQACLDLALGGCLPDPLQAGDEERDLADQLAAAEAAPRISTMLVHQRPFKSPDPARCMEFLFTSDLPRRMGLDYGTLAPYIRFPLGKPDGVVPVLLPGQQPAPILIHLNAWGANPLVALAQLVAKEKEPAPSDLGGGGGLAEEEEEDAQPGGQNERARLARLLGTVGILLRDDQERKDIPDRAVRARAAIPGPSSSTATPRFLLLLAGHSYDNSFCPGSRATESQIDCMRAALGMPPVGKTLFTDLQKLEYLPSLPKTEPAWQALLAGWLYAYGHTNIDLVLDALRQGVPMGPGLLYAAGLHDGTPRPAYRWGGSASFLPPNTVKALIEYQGHPELLLTRALLAAGARGFAALGNGLTVLHKAHNPAFCSLIIDQGADLDSVCTSGGWRTPVFTALRMGRWEVALVMLRTGAALTPADMVDLMRPQGVPASYSKGPAHIKEGYMQKLVELVSRAPVWPRLCRLPVAGALTRYFCEPNMRATKALLPLLDLFLRAMPAAEFVLPVLHTAAPVNLLTPEIAPENWSVRFPRVLEQFRARKRPDRPSLLDALDVCFGTGLPAGLAVDLSVVILVVLWRATIIRAAVHVDDRTVFSVRYEDEAQRVRAKELMRQQQKFMTGALRRQVCDDEPVGLPSLQVRNLSVQRTEGTFRDAICTIVRHLQRALQPHQQADAPDSLAW
ncbi:hypothetical protein PAPYR_2008 [Paratrimastix pyriformis]|uniref:F-box domain-containing protein n=1 Tax=Paratrimastix pyriformis TaxID=342808 RepID=A0ABQ8UQK3_9EUKA|nr:hypothetical protein PAPYR_2008 [Paratrimastix pyriformis]